MKTQHTILLICAVICLCLTSCSKNSAGGCPSATANQKEMTLQEAQSATLDAQAQYVSESTTQNCQAYRQAHDAYVVALKDWVQCLDTPGNWQQVVAQAEQQNQAIQC